MAKNFGFQENGFVNPTIEEAVTYVIDVHKNRHGQDITVRPEDWQGKNILALADLVKDVYNDLEDAFYNTLVQTAKGIYLRYATFNLQPMEAKPSQVSLRFVLEDGAMLSAGDQFRVAGGSEIFTLSSSYTASVPLTDPAPETPDTENKDLFAQSTSTGTASNSILPDTITESIRDIEGLVSVTNPASPRGGRVAETDEEYRIRSLNIAERGNILSSSVASIRHALLGLEGVTLVKMLENIEDDTDSETGLVGHSIEAIVRGGTEADIIRTLRERVAGGIAIVSEAQGANKKTQTFDGLDYSFSVPSNAFISFNVVVTTSLTTLPETAIKDYIIEFIGGSDSAGIIHQGLDIGEDITAYQVASILYDRDRRLDIQNAVVTLGRGLTNPTFGNSVSIGLREEAATNSALINVTTP